MPSSVLLPLTVLADDLTGAMDSGLQFADRGIETVVHLSPGAITDTAITVVSSESRDLSPTAAIDRVHALLPVLEGRRVFKKIDSTLRGNVGYELRALLNDLALRTAVVAPAFPQGGRTLVNGRLLVGGLPLAMSAFRSDPRWPMTESYVPTYLMQQSGLEVSHISLGVVEQGTEALAVALRACHSRLVLVDATSDLHLESIAEAIRDLGAEWMPCGSAGLARAWAALLDQGTAARASFAKRRQRGMLFVAGSRNPVTLAQLGRLADSGAVRITLDSRGSYEQRLEDERLIETVSRALGQGKDTILEATSSALLPGGGPRVVEILSQVVGTVVEQDLVGGLFLTGGEIALAACRALGVRALRILEAIEPGIPGGQFIGGSASAMPAVTKAGGFGSPEALVAARDWLHVSTETPRIVNPTQEEMV